MWFRCFLHVKISSGWGSTTQHWFLFSIFPDNRSRDLGADKWKSGCSHIRLRHRRHNRWCGNFPQREKPQHPGSPGRPSGQRPSQLFHHRQAGAFRRQLHHRRNWAGTCHPKHGGSPHWRRIAYLGHWCRQHDLPSSTWRRIFRGSVHRAECVGSSAGGEEDWPWSHSCHMSVWHGSQVLWETVQQEGVRRAGTSGLFAARVSSLFAWLTTTSASRVQSLCMSMICTTIFL